MSYNLVDPVTGDLTQVAGSIDTSMIPSDASASNKLVTEETVNTEVAHIKRFDSVPGNDWNNAIEEGYYTISIDAVADTIENRPFNYAIQMRVIKSDTNEPNYVYQIAYVSSQDSRIYIRKQNGEGIWTSWGEIATMDKVESKYSEENILTSTDWNTLNTKARYYFSGGTPMTNAPEVVPFGLLEVINVGAYCRIQRYFAFNGKLYIRRWSGGNWNEWYRFDGISI